MTELNKSTIARTLRRNDDLTYLAYVGDATVSGDVRVAGGRWVGNHYVLTHAMRVLPLLTDEAEPGLFELKGANVVRWNIGEAPNVATLLRPAPGSIAVRLDDDHGAPIAVRDRGDGWCYRLVGEGGRVTYVDTEYLHLIAGTDEADTLVHRRSFMQAATSALAPVFALDAADMVVGLAMPVRKAGSTT